MDSIVLEFFTATTPTSKPYQLRLDSVTAVLGQGIRRMQTKGPWARQTTRFVGLDTQHL
jgi:hypothetical protein